jgi:TonB family protein
MRALTVGFVALWLSACGSPPADAPPQEGATPPAGTGDAPAAATAPPASTSAAVVATAGPPAAPVATATAKAPLDGPNAAPLLGKLTDADVQATLTKNYSKLDPCYPDSLRKKNGDIKVQLKPTIGPTGKVNEALVMKSSGDKKFDSCVVDAFKKIQFPISKEGSTFVNPTWIELGGQVVPQ